eukprot:6457234-Amphidinium_carterae.3
MLRSACIVGLDASWFKAALHRSAALELMAHGGPTGDPRVAPELALSECGSGELLLGRFTGDWFLGFLRFPGKGPSALSPQMKRAWAHSQPSLDG